MEPVSKRLLTIFAFWYTYLVLPTLILNKANPCDHREIMDMDFVNAKRHCASAWKFFPLLIIVGNAKCYIML